MKTSARLHRTSLHAGSVALLCIATAFSRPASIDPMESAFRTPPDSVRPWVYWVWTDGNLSREGITADLEAMKRAGIGGVMIMEVDVGVPKGKVGFMSPEWRKLFRHVVRESERCGLEIALLSGPGWSGSGGPWVTPGQSMQHIVGASIEVEGPARYAGFLPRAARRPSFFGEHHLPPELEKAKDEFYRDVAVVAYPTPPAKDSISDIEEKALYVRAPYSSQRGVRPFIPAPADYEPPRADAVIDPARVIDIAERCSPEGRLTWNVPEGRWTIVRFGRTSTGANTRPAPAPGLGLECDKQDTAAIDAHYRAFIGELLREVGPRRNTAGGGWTMLHIDSWEMGAQNWTGMFRSEFRSRRGYDLLPYLPVMTGSVVGSHEVSERFLWDLRETANELILENHARRFRELGRRDGFTLSLEPYDMTPCADMSLGSTADVPMCEFWLYGFNTSYSVFEATSIAHTCGKQEVAAEAFTSGEEEKWQAFPGSMKPLGDWAFASGVNRFVFHRYQHQPWLRIVPGMTMGPYGVHWERTQTWWGMAHAYHSYLSRCQFMLRQGLPVADVCFLVGEGAPRVFRPPASAVEGEPPDRKGYNFDGCAPDVLISRMSVKEGVLTLPDGMSYRALVLPEQATMTPTLLKKVEELVREGATVIGPPPRKSPGLSGYPLCDEEVRAVAAKVWGDCDGVNVTRHNYARGRVVWVRGAWHETDSLRSGMGAAEPEQYCDYRAVTDELARQGLMPDFESVPAVRYAHRRAGDTEIYFLANPADRACDALCTFRTGGKEPELWDPVTGDVRTLRGAREAAGRTSLAIRFEPYQSWFVIFRRPRAALPAPGQDFPALTPLAGVEGPWNVTFDTSHGGPESATFTRLEDWTRRSEEGIRYYSGTATYTTTFDLPKRSADGSPAGEVLWLDVGRVENMAEVTLNGRNLGVLWCAPWRVNVTGVVKPSGNRLEIRVANLWPNRLIGDEQLPPVAEYGKRGGLVRWPEWLMAKDPVEPPGRRTFATWKQFAANSPLLPSGLLGPVRVLRAGE